MLLQVPDFLTLAEVKQARSLLERGSWVDGRGTASGHAAAVKRNLQLRSDSEEVAALQALVLDAVTRHEVFVSCALPKRALPPRFNRYAGEANTYGNHIDSAVFHHPQNGQPIRADLSCTVFLTDPGDYDGGELVIEDTFGDRPVKLPAGSAVLYPGTSVHRVEPVTRGERLASFFWIESLVRSDEQRRLLFELDKAISALRRQHAEWSPELVTLSGTYHNLMRMWTET